MLMFFTFCRVALSQRGWGGKCNSSGGIKKSGEYFKQKKCCY